MSEKMYTHEALKAAELAAFLRGAAEATKGMEERDAYNYRRGYYAGQQAAGSYEDRRAHALEIARQIAHEAKEWYAYYRRQLDSSDPDEMRRSSDTFGKYYTLARVVDQLVFIGRVDGTLREHLYPVTPSEY